MYKDRIVYLEWVAWREMCGQLAKLGLDVNEERFKPFVLAAKLWGERLHALRVEEPQHEEPALKEAELDYMPHRLGLE